MKKAEAIVGVRELRARLSAYLRAVAQGKTVTIGDRRRQPVARLVPVRRSARRRRPRSARVRGARPTGRRKAERQATRDVTHPPELVSDIASRIAGDPVSRHQRPGEAVRRGRAGSGVAAAVDQATAVATVRITYAEARAAFARHTRAGGLTAGDLRRVIRQLDEEWGQYTLVEVTDALVRRAGTLAERHGLRAYDAVQLSAAVDVRLAGGADVAFASFDARLSLAARRERLRIQKR